MKPFRIQEFDPYSCKAIITGRFATLAGAYKAAARKCEEGFILLTPQQGRVGWRLDKRGYRREIEVYKEIDAADQF